jgi:hypothetical protein
MSTYGRSEYCRAGQLFQLTGRKMPRPCKNAIIFRLIGTARHFRKENSHKLVFPPHIRTNYGLIWSYSSTCNFISAFLHGLCPLRSLGSPVTRAPKRPLPRLQMDSAASSYIVGDCALIRNASTAAFVSGLRLEIPS